MKLYITGMAGMLGCNIYASLKDRAEITGIDILDTEDIRTKSTGMERGLSYKKISLFDPEAVEQDLAMEKPEVLIHTAAFVNVDGCEENPKEAERLNADVTAYLAQLCHASGIRMAYISTDAVFDGRDDRLYSEEDAPNPLNVYGKTKLSGERAVLQYGEHLVLRTNIYGINIQRKQSFGEWVYHSLEEGRTLSMFTDIDFSPLPADELAELIFLACRKRLRGLYHACGTGCITKYEFGVKLKEISGIKTGSIQKSISGAAGLRAERPKHMGMSNRRLSEALGVEISTPKQGIERFCRKIKAGEAEQKIR